ncbi:MAG: S8 family serine peptidase [Bdellovibrionales bacterium]|nr:S8 family serine peptidase [Bdellovibrionales bacterium]
MLRIQRSLSSAFLLFITVGLLGTFPAEASARPKSHNEKGFRQRSFLQRGNLSTRTQRRLARYLPRQERTATLSEANSLERCLVQIDWSKLKETVSRLSPRVQKTALRNISQTAQWHLESYGKVEHQFGIGQKGVFVFNTESCTDLAASSPYVIKAEADLQLQYKTSDTHFDRFQWNLRNTGQNFEDSIGPGTPGLDLNIERAWEIHENHEEAVVAIFEYGIDSHHPDLEASLFNNSAELEGLPGVDDDGNGYVDDIHGINVTRNNGDIDMHRAGLNEPHGTGVGGIAVAQANNNFGIAGVFDGAKLLTLTSDNPYESFLAFLSQITEGIEYLIDMKERYDAGENGANVRVINLSIGADLVPCRRNMLVAIDTFLDATARANEAGIVVITGSSNTQYNHDNPATPEFPTNCEGPNHVAVANATRIGTLKSGFGANTVALSAPGDQVLVSWWFPNTGSANALVSGTSFASPSVAAVIAMINSMYPSLKPSEVIEILIESSRHLSTLEGKITSEGMVDAYAALLLAGERAIDTSAPSNVSIVVKGGPIVEGDAVTFELHAEDTSGIGFIAIRNENDLLAYSEGRLRDPSATDGRWLPIAFDSPSISLVDYFGAGLHSATLIICDIHRNCTDTGPVKFVVNRDGRGIPGDADLNGYVDYADFSVWYSNRFTSRYGVANGDFNLDGSVDGKDYNIWNKNRFTGLDLATLAMSVP